MAFRNPLTTIPAAGITGLIGGSQLAADSINGKTIRGATVIGAVLETADTGTARIVMGPPAYIPAGGPAISWDLAGTGVDWSEPHIWADPTTKQLSILGQQFALGVAGILITDATAGTSAVQLVAYSANGVNAAALKANGETGNLEATGPVVASAEPWKAPGLANGWINYGGTPAIRPAGYRKMADGTVMLRGLVKLGALNAAIFTLPAGYRPNIEEVFVCHAAAATNCRVDVFPDGTVKVVNYDTGGTNAFVSLSGIRFSYTG